MRVTAGEGMGFHFFGLDGMRETKLRSPKTKKKKGTMYGAPATGKKQIASASQPFRESGQSKAERGVTVQQLQLLVHERVQLWCGGGFTFRKPPNRAKRFESRDASRQQFGRKAQTQWQGDEPSRCAMHGYSTESNERRLVPLLLALVAIGLAWSSTKLLASLSLTFPWWADAPSTLAFYALLYRLFDKYLWRSRVIRRLGLCKIPNVAGCWRGFLTSSFDGPLKQHEVVVQIFQSWTQISVFLATITSISASRVAAIEASAPEGVSLIYTYENQPLSNATKTMHMHYGTAMLRIAGDNFTGEYYAGRDRRTFGRITCWKMERESYRARAEIAAPRTATRVNFLITVGSLFCAPGKLEAGSRDAPVPGYPRRRTPALEESRQPGFAHPNNQAVRKYPSCLPRQRATSTFFNAGSVKSRVKRATCCLKKSKPTASTE